MNTERRSVLRHTAGAAALGLLAAAGVLRPGLALAAAPERAPFAATTLSAALQALGAGNAQTSGEILIGAPDVAENGASVPLDITSRLPGTRRLAVLVDDNPQPLAMQLEFAPGVQARFHGRIKMGRSSTVRVLAEADGRSWLASRAVQVTVGGCGA